MLPPDWESICSSTSQNTTPAVLPQDDQSESHNTGEMKSSIDDTERSLSLESSNSSSVLLEAKHIGEFVKSLSLCLSVCLSVSLSLSLQSPVGHIRAHYNVHTLSIVWPIG